MSYDAIVVGARCGGAATAMALARRGYRTLLLDRATFPSDIMSTHLVKPSGVSRLRRWGLLPRVAASGCPPLTTISVDLGDFTLTASLPPVDGLSEMFAPRRTVLDTILVEAAVHAGAELREAVTVQDLSWSADTVSGVRARARNGTTFEERGRIVVGADGMRSRVARVVEAPAYDEVPTRACWYYSYWSGLALDAFRVHARRGRYVLAFPTNDALTCILVGWPLADFRTVRAAPEEHVHAALDAAAPDLGARVREGRREERYVGTADVPGYFRKPFGHGWALVGDAGYHRDPSTGWGIADAFRDAESLADAIDDGFTGRQPLDDALADYERARNAAARPYYERTCQAATLGSPPQAVLDLRAALRYQPAQASRYMGAIQGTVPILEYFAPENVARIMAGAPPSESDPARSPTADAG